MEGLDAASGAAERELVIARTIDAPRERVFDAWCDPAHIGQWWGPNGFSTDVGHMDVRPGGEWRFTMYGPDGSEYRNRIVYAEVDRPGRLCYAQGDDAGSRFEAEVTFGEQGGGTLVTLRLICQSAQQRAEMERSGAMEGARQTLERLERYLAGYGSEM